MSPNLFRARIVTVLFICAIAGCAAPRLGESSLSRDEKWREDVDCLARELPLRHKNAFFKCSRESFEAAAAQLRENVPRLADHEVVVGMLRLIAMIGDGHTQAQNYAQVGGFRSLPLFFEWLRDGYYVTRATRSNMAVLGARLVRIGSTPIDEAARRLNELFPLENEMQLRRRAPLSLRCPELLHACRLIEQLDSVELTFDDGKGQESSMVLTPTAPGVELRWVYASELVSLAEQRPLDAYWYKCVVTPHWSAMYLAYNTCSGHEAFGKVCAKMFEGIPKGSDESASRWRLIIDLRRNGGGNSSVIDAIHPHLLWRPELRKPGRVLVLMGRNTFSSAMMNAIQLRQRYGAVLIGEPTGGSPNAYGEIRPLSLPHSKLVVMYSTNYFSLQDDGAQTVTPDVLVEPTIDDIIAGRDPVLDAALYYSPERAGADAASK